MSENVIFLDKEERYDEATANAEVYPGHLVERRSDGKIQKHSVDGGPGELLLVQENSLIGGTIDDPYAANDWTRIGYVGRGKRAQVRLGPNALAVVKGNYICSAGDGRFRKAQYAKSVVKHSVAASTDVTNTVSTEQVFDVTAVLAALTLKAGDVVHIQAAVVVSAAAGGDTLTVKFYMGALLIAASAAVNSTTGDILVFDLYVTVRSVGATGKVFASGFVSNGVEGTATALPLVLDEATLDTTAAATVTASATWSATTATCTCALQSLNVDIDRANGADAALAVANSAVDNSEEDEEDAMLEVLGL